MHVYIYTYECVLVCIRYIILNSAVYTDTRATKHAYIHAYTTRTHQVVLIDANTKSELYQAFRLAKWQGLSAPSRQQYEDGHPGNTNVYNLRGLELT